MPYLREKKVTTTLTCDQTFQLRRAKQTARERTRERWKLSCLSPPLVHAALAWLLASPSNGELVRRLRLPTQRRIPVSRKLTDRRPTNLPNSSLDLVALSSYNFICLKQKNHMIFNSYLCQCPPSTHSYFFFYAAYALFFIRTIFKRTSKLAKKKKKSQKKKEHAKNIPEEPFFTAFTFQNPENLNYIMSYLESEHTKILFFQHIPNGYGQYLHLHCTCTIH